MARMVIAAVVVMMTVIAVVVMTATCQLQRKESYAGGGKDAADDRALSRLDRRAELQANGDDHRAEDDRDDHMRGGQ